MPAFAGKSPSLAAPTIGAGDVRGLVPPAVFKTVCGALLRRPGWVRFPSIPAKIGGRDRQADSHSSRRQRAFMKFGRRVRSIETILEPAFWAMRPSHGLPLTRVGFETLLLEVARRLVNVGRQGPAWAQVQHSTSKNRRWRSP